MSLMREQLIDMGDGTVRYAPTGELIEAASLPNELGYEFGYDDDDFGEDDDDDFGEYDDDDFGEDDDDFGAEDDDDDFEGEFAGKGRRGKRKRRRNKRRGRRGSWEAAFLVGSDTQGGAGTATVTIRPQADFISEDISFEGSLAGTKITGIKFGKETVFSNSKGIPITLFATTSQLRNRFSGYKVRAGLDITITGSVTGAGDLAVTLFGKQKK